MPNKFKKGDLVWAKMKGFPPWPGNVVEAPAGIRRPSQASKKPFQCVYFYGSENYAWMAEEVIKDYADYREKFCKLNKPSQQLKEAIEKSENVYQEYLVLKQKRELNEFPEDLASHFILNSEFCKPAIDNNIGNNKTKSLQSTIEGIHKRRNSSNSIGTSSSIELPSINDELDAIFKASSNNQAINNNNNHTGSTTSSEDLANQNIINNNDNNNNDGDFDQNFYGIVKNENKSCDGYISVSEGSNQEFTSNPYSNDDISKTCNLNGHGLDITLQSKQNNDVFVKREQYNVGMATERLLIGEDEFDQSDVEDRDQSLSETNEMPTSSHQVVVKDEYDSHRAQQVIAEGAEEIKKECEPFESAMEGLEQATNPTNPEVPITAHPKKRKQISELDLDKSRIALRRKQEKITRAKKVLRTQNGDNVFSALNTYNINDDTTSSSKLEPGEPPSLQSVRKPRNSAITKDKMKSSRTPRGSNLGNKVSHINNHSPRSSGGPGRKPRLTASSQNTIDNKNTSNNTRISSLDPSDLLGGHHNTPASNYRQSRPLLKSVFDQGNFPLYDTPPLSGRTNDGSSTKKLSSILMLEGDHNLPNNSKFNTLPNKLPQISHEISPTTSSKGVGNYKKTGANSVHSLNSNELQDIQSRSLKLGFLGTGILGKQIVHTLLNAGHQICVWNRDQSKCQELIKAGATNGTSPEDVFSNCNIVFCCFSEHNALRKMILTDDGIIRSLKDGKGIVNLSSNTYKTSSDLAEVIQSLNSAYLEAPIFGSNSGDNGFLLVLAAGDVTLYKQCEPLFRLIGRPLYLGFNETHSAKVALILKSLQGTLIASLAESLSLAEKTGIKPDDILSILKISMIDCPLFRQKGKEILEGLFIPNLPLKHQQSDIKLTLDMADDLEHPTPLLSTANELFKRAKNVGCGNSDVSAVHKAFYL